jgi:toxin ParE1/3/4
MGHKISVEADDDLENIWLYTFETWSPKQAGRYINLIFDEIEYLSNHPKSGKDFSHLRDKYRCSKVKSHLIFYRQISGTGIEMISILQQRIDIQDRLTE